MTVAARLQDDADVYDWRRDQLAGAGYPNAIAAELAARDDVDLRVAVYLLQAGCPLGTALRILR